MIRRRRGQFYQESCAIRGPVGRHRRRYAQDPVNRPMIRHFVEAMGDENPIYLDGRRPGGPAATGIVAPPPMLSTWLMVGLPGTPGRRTGAAGRHSDGPAAGRPERRPGSPAWSPPTMSRSTTVSWCRATTFDDHRHRGRVAA